MKLIHSLLLLASMTINGSIVKIRSVALFTAISATTAIASRTSTMITTTTTMRRTAALNQSPLETLSASSSPPPSSSFIALPLLPFHVVKSRRLRELREAGMLPDDEEAVTDTTSNHYDYSHHDSNNIQNLSASSHYPHGTREEEEIYRRKYRRMIQSEHEHNRDLRSPELSALYQGYGTHYVDLWVGTPPQRQTVIVDTGSGVTAFPCEECNNCGESYHTDSYFKESRSSTFDKLTCGECMKGTCQSLTSTCHIGMSYQEGSSWSAYEVKDTAYLGGYHHRPLSMADLMNDDDMAGINPQHGLSYSFDLDFGCQTHITGLFRTQLANGIMGMSNVFTSVWKQIHDQGIIDTPTFSLCFSRKPSASRDGSEAGTITLGGTYTNIHSTPLVYAQNIKKAGFYAIKLRKMYLLEGGALSVSDPSVRNNKDLLHQLDVDESTLNSHNVIVDSGTTDTYLNKAMMQPFHELWKELTGKEYSNSPLSLREDQILKLPTLLFQIYPSTNEPTDDNTDNDNLPHTNNGPNSAEDFDDNHPTDVLIAMPPIHYLEFDSDTEKYVPRIYLEETGGSVLGANFMQNHDVVFDIPNYRIGFAESSCDYNLMVYGIPSSHEDPFKKIGYRSYSCGTSCQVLLGFVTSVLIAGLGFAVYKYIKRNRIGYSSAATQNNMNTTTQLREIDEDLAMPEFT